MVLKMILENTIFGEVDMVAIAIERLREHEPPEGYYGAFSGGKDSCVIKELAKMAGVRVDWHYSLTTVDPPSWYSLSSESIKMLRLLGRRKLCGN